jgi:signal transduction histidine kinase/CheY-like chemotaxis protein
VAAVVVSVSAATLLRLMLQPVLGERAVFPLAILAVAVSAHLAGMWAGVATMFLAIPIAVVLFLDRAGPAALGTPAWLQVLLSTAMAVPLCLLGGRFHHLVHELDQALHRERAARTEAEHANRAKDDFLATLSHELRTPLNAIVGWAHVLSTPGLDAATQQKAAQTIHRNAQAQNQLVADLLDVSRIVSGKLTLNVRTIDLHQVVQRAIETISPACQAKGIRVEAILDPGCGPASGDPDRLQQVVWNLLANAVKFTPTGGRIQVHLQPVSSHVEIVVADNGPGIPPERLARVFERFWQGDASPSRSHGGLGLGLAIVRHLVELHGGTVTAANRDAPAGAIFTVRLPMPVLAESATARARTDYSAGLEAGWSSPLPSLSGLRVLAVDDEKDTRELLRDILARCGAQVSIAASARDALSAIPSARPDVIVADIGMPEQDGYSFIAKVRALPTGEGGTTPVLALTAFARGEDRLKALKAGFDMHVPKPVEPIELATAIRGLADRRHPGYRSI